MFAGFIMERFPCCGGGGARCVHIPVSGHHRFRCNCCRSFSNSAPITIAAMFILSGALLRTGTLDAVAGWIIKSGH
jgi:hypothetical protein